MIRRKLGLIVEGKGEVKALPILVRRTLANRFPGMALDIPMPFLLKRGLMTKRVELSQAVEAVAREVGPGAPILVVLDSDADLGCVLAQGIRSMAIEARSDRLVGVVAAVREYEAWLIAGLAPLAGTLGLVPDLPPVDDAESLPNPKAWLKRQMLHSYTETIDQAILTRNIDLSLARRAYSFDKLERELIRLLDLNPTISDAPPRRS